MAEMVGNGSMNEGPFGLRPVPGDVKSFVEQLYRNEQIQRRIFPLFPKRRHHDVEEEIHNGIIYFTKRATGGKLIFMWGLKTLDDYTEDVAKKTIAYIRQYVIHRMMHRNHREVEVRGKWWRENAREGAGVSHEDPAEIVSQRELLAHCERKLSPEQACLLRRYLEGDNTDELASQFLRHRTTIQRRIAAIRCYLIVVLDHLLDGNGNN